jgi:hypothetical protein
MIFTASVRNILDTPSYVAGNNTRRRAGICQTGELIVAGEFYDLYSVSLEYSG